MPSATGWWASDGRVNAALRAGVHALEDAQAMRRAGRELLSLALIDARNHLLALLAQDESPAALQRAAHAGWYQEVWICLLYTSPSPRDRTRSRMPSSA